MDKKCFVLASLYLALLTAGASAQSPTGYFDELWVEPPVWNVDGTPSSGVRSDFIPVLTDPGAWPTVLGRTARFTSLINFLTKQNQDDPAQLAALGCFLRQQDVGVDLNVGAVRLRPKGCDPTVAGACNRCDEAGDRMADSDWNALQLWLDIDCGAGVLQPPLTSLSADHPILFGLRTVTSNGDPACDLATAPSQVVACDGMSYPLDLTDSAKDFADVAFWAGEVADYYQSIQQRLYDAYTAGDLAERIDLEIGFWEGAATFPVAGYSSNSSLQIEVDLQTVLAELQCQLAKRELDDPDQTGAKVPLELQYFQIDHGSQGVCFDAGYPAKDCRGENGNLDFPLQVPDWDLGRVIEVERVARDLGLRVGISNHLGNVAHIVDPIGGDQRARDLFVRYVDEYLSAGGSPDYLQAYGWHSHPGTTGPETAPFSFLGIVEEVLATRYPPLVESILVDDEFTSTAPFATSFDTAGDPCWQVLPGLGTGILEQSCASGTRVAGLEGGPTGSLQVGFITKLLAGSGWLGVHLRKADAADLPWHSGYLVLVRPLASGSGAQGEVALCKGTGTNCATLASAPLDFDPTAGWHRLEIDARGNRFRIAIDGEPLIDLTDTAADRRLDGEVSLITAARAARIDGLEILRIDP